MTIWMSPKVIKRAFPRFNRNNYVALFALILFPISGYAADPPDCSGYPEQRTFLEAQSWWWLSDKTDRVQSGDDFGHVHVGTCFPHGQTVSGDVEFDVRLVMHHNPGYIHHLVISVWDDEPDNCWASGTACVDLRDNPLTCSAGDTCVWWFHVVVPTDTLSSDGRKEFRFRPFMEQPDGNRLFPSTGWQAYVDNGRSVNDYRSSDTVEARGWYTGTEYQIARLDVLPDEPVSGTWTPRVHMKPGSGGGPSTYHLAMIDPNFHSNPPSEGVVVKEGKGQFVGDLEIDTTALSDGWHRLALRTDFDMHDDPECMLPDGSFCDSTDSAVNVTWFEVNNGKAANATPKPPENLQISSAGFKFNLW
jgi:hypothetical protein